MLIKPVQSPCSFLRVCYQTTLLVLTVSIDSICCDFFEVPLILKSELEENDKVLSCINCYIIVTEEGVNPLISTTTTLGIAPSGTVITGGPAVVVSK